LGKECYEKEKATIRIVVSKNSGKRKYISKPIY
jgi:hypothetical protein